jgi:hypothetical protein
MIEMINIADFVDPNDPERRTYRQINAARQHNIPLGALVELPTGVRMFVVHHSRDCDETPLYHLSYNAKDTEQERPNFYNRSWAGGFPEQYLTVVRLP